jgi:hypothetical protein
MNTLRQHRSLVPYATVVVVSMVMMVLGSCSNSDLLTRPSDSSAPNTVDSTAPSQTTNAVTTSPSTVPSPTAPSTSAASTTTVAPTTSIDALTAAQQEYLSIASTANTALADLFAPYAALGYVPWAEFPQYCAAAAVAEEAFTTAMRSYSWPRQARTAAALQVTTNAELTSDYQECAGTEATQAALADVDSRITAADARSTAAANNFRAAIGLQLND